MKMLILFALVSVLPIRLSAESPVEQEKLDLPELVNIIDRYNIPKPPKQAELYFTCTGSWTVLGNRSTDHDPSIYVAGLALHPADPNKLEKADVIVGFTQSTVKRNDFYSPALRKYTATPEKAKAKGYYYDAGEVTNFATALQCERLGLHDEAKSLMKLFQESEYVGGLKTQESGRPYLNEYELFTARMIYEFYYIETLRPNSDLKKCLFYLEKLKAEYSRLFSFEKLSYPAKRRAEFIADLKTTVTTPAPAVGSIEELIINYANLDKHNARKNELAKQIYLKGVKAIPVLVRLYDDNRLTKQMMPGIMNSPSFVVRVRHSVSELLGDMTNVNYRDKQQWQEWLKHQDLTDEKKFLLKMARSKDKEKKFEQNPVRILLLKYPDEIEPLLTEISNQVSEELHTYAGMIFESKQKDEVKVALLKKLYHRRKGFQRRSMLQYLVKIDEKSVLKELNDLIAKIPKDVKTPYWTADEAELTHVVAQVSDLATWQNYYRKTKSCKVGLRMEIMNPLNYSYLKNKNRERRIAFLVAFLDDAEVRTRTSANKWSGPHAAFRYEKISVQNFVAEKLNSMLGLKEHPTEFWKEAQWAKLRQRIKEKVVTMELPSLK